MLGTQARGASAPGLATAPRRLLGVFRRQLTRKLLQMNTLAFTDTRACLLNAPKEAGIGFQAIVEPLIFRMKAYENARGPTVARDDNLFAFR